MELQQWELEQRSSTNGARTKKLDMVSQKSKMSKMSKIAGFRGQRMSEHAENVGKPRLLVFSLSLSTKDLDNWSSKTGARQLDLQQNSSTIGAATKGLDKGGSNKRARELELQQKSSRIGATTKELDNWSSKKEAWHGFGEVENVENVGNSVVLWPIKVGAGRKSRKTRCF